MNKPLLLFLIVSLVPICTPAQSHIDADSLIAELSNQKSDTVKINICIQLCNILCAEDPDKAMEYGQQGLNLSVKLGYKRGMAASTQNIGLVMMYTGDYVFALKHLQKALKLAEEISDRNIVSKCLFSIGNVHYYMKNFDTALEYYEKSILADKELGLEKEIALCWLNIGNVYKMKNEFDQAMGNYHQALNIFLKLDDKLVIAGCYNNIARMHEKLNEYPEAVSFYEKALSVNLEIGNKKGQSMVLANIANMKNTAKDFRGAVENALTALKISRDIQDKYLECGICDILSESYDSLKNYKTSLYYAKQFIALNDSLLNVEKNKQLSEMESKYQTEKKQILIDKLGKEKELQKSELQKQRLVIWFMITGLLVIAIFSSVLFRLFIQKKKANKLLAAQKKEIELKNEALNQQNEEIRTQRDEIEAQRDEIAVQKGHIEEQKQEITDSINYAKRIQQALMPEIQQVEMRHGTSLLEFFVLFKPKDIVSGDFYWATQIGKTLIVTVADCTGHGVPGAFMSMLGISFLNEIVRKKEITKAGDVLDNLRDSIIEALQQKGVDNEQKDGMDIALCAINTETLEMQFAGANNPIYIVQTGHCPVCTMHEIRPDKMPIGIHDRLDPFSNQVYQLQKGDLIYLMSDGFEDQFGGPQRKKFLAKNLKNLLTANCQLPMANQKQILETTLVEWIGNGEQIDDITILGIRL